MDHVIEGEAGHHHGHDHDHHHGPAEYFKEQLITIFVCGAFGLVGILMYQFEMLKYILAPDFRLPVLLGGIALLVLTAIRAVALWKEAGRQMAQQAHVHTHDNGHNHHHDHAPGEACDHPDHDHSHQHHHHDHGHHHHHGHSHDDHDHGNVYWRVVILGFPIVLFLLGIPNSTFSKDWIEKRLGNTANIGDVQDVAVKEGAVATYDFNTLALATHSEDRMRDLEGTPAKIKGQVRFVPNNQKQLELFYLKMTCCATDIVPLQARIIVNQTSDYAGINPFDWVEVSGTIQFKKVQDRYITIIRVRDKAGVVKIPPVE
jgi:hypothetical protein